MSDRIEAEIPDVFGEEVDAEVDTPLVVIEGTKGDPGIYYGTTQPTGDTHPVWIDPDGSADDGGLLPAVTAADNGKVLRVVSGAWAAADMPSGGETWELIDVIPLTAGVTLYDIANLSKYRKIAISVSKPVTTEGNGTAFIRIYKLSDTNLSALSYNLDSNFFKSAYGYIELAKDGAFVRLTELYRNNRSTPASGGPGVPIDGLDLDDLGGVRIVLPEAYSQNFDGTGTMTIRGIK